MRDRIQSALDQVERDHDVRILLAVESGSRAWGFPSRDSDWDVRFIYAHKAERYLSIAPLRDVIEVPLEDDLDLGGWDIRKALSLMVASNAVALEWLGSPIVYRHDPSAMAALGAFARRVAHLPALAYHYDRLARRSWPPAPPGPMRLKDVFYALRPACALTWMRRHATPPPMDLPALIAGLSLPPAVGDAIEHLTASKQSSREADAGPVPEVLAAFIDEVLADPAPRPGALDRSVATGQADELFRGILHFNA